jgi:hypothetical protein
VCVCVCVCVCLLYRGYCARKDIAAVKQQYLCRMATKIQKCWRAYAAWKVRREIHARRHMAAWKIQYQIHGFFDIDGQRRIQAKTAARRRREELAEKMRLLTISREGALERRKQDFMNIFARRIQKRWRRYSNNKRRKAEALLNRAKLQEDMQEEAVTIQSKRFLARIGNPLVGLQRMFTSAWKVAGKVTFFAFSLSIIAILYRIYKWTVHCTNILIILFCLSSSSPSSSLSI